MKLFHLADLHLGKRLFECSLLEDQAYILNQILALVESEMPNAVLLAGDIYDKPVPPTEAVTLFDSFLTELRRRNIPVFIISGNHDSPERLSFLSKLLTEGGIYISPSYAGEAMRVILTDEYGEISFTLLPHLRPSSVRRFFPNHEIADYADAVKLALGEPKAEGRQVLLAHQLIIGGERSDSEELIIGGSEEIPAELLSGYDYIALGHLHRPQNIKGIPARYAGTPLKYSFSEAGHQKSVTVAEIKGKGELSLRELPLSPLHEMRELRGTYFSIAEEAYRRGKPSLDYLHITLTDETDIPDALAKLRIHYPNLLKLDYDNTRTRAMHTIDMAEAPETKDMLTLFSEFYLLQNGAEMDEESLTYLARLQEKMQEGEA